MRPLKTIIATAVIGFALTAVAMAGVQHYTKTPDARATGKVPVRYTVSLTAKQLAQLMGQGKAATARTVRHARPAQRRHQATHHQSSHGASYRSFAGSSSSGRSYSRSSSPNSYRCSNHSGCRGNDSGSRSGGGGCW